MHNYLSNFLNNMHKFSVARNHSWNFKNTGKKVKKYYANKPIKHTEQQAKNRRVKQIENGFLTVSNGLIK